MRQNMGAIAWQTLAIIGLITAWCLAPSQVQAGLNGESSQLGELGRDEISHLPVSRTFGPIPTHQRLHLSLREANPSNQSHKLRLHNLCPHTVEIAVRYQDLQQSWKIQGWQSIPGNSSRYLSSSPDQAVDISQKLLYYYAQAPDSGLVWSGFGRHQYVFDNQILKMRIHYAAVDILGNYSLFILCNEGDGAELEQ